MQTTVGGIANGPNRKQVKAQHRTFSLLHLGLLCIKPTFLCVSIHQPHTIEANDVNTARIRAMRETAGGPQTQKLSVITWWEG